jgi:predicted O-methyltransferase YrrM
MKAFYLKLLTHSRLVLPCVDFILRLADVLLAPLVLVSSIVLYVVRRSSLERRAWKMPVSRAIFRWIGVFPIIRHYYEPFPLAPENPAPRRLTGIDLNVEGQLAFVKALKGVDELAAFPLKQESELRFHHINYSFQFVDAEFLYLVIRTIKPKRIIEIGSGYSTLMMLEATRANATEGAPCGITCIEPFEYPMLERSGATIVRAMVEDVEPALFETLERNDILFIDSSHIIRPGGDVLAEYLSILPALKPGVFVHVHDIFTPLDYAAYVRGDHVLLWNEQYLLEAFLTLNRDFSIVGALNYLQKHHPDQLGAACISQRSSPTSVAGSFWLQKVA